MIALTHYASLAPSTFPNTLAEASYEARLDETKAVNARRGLHDPGYAHMAAHLHFDGLVPSHALPRAAWGVSLSLVQAWL